MDRPGTKLVEQGLKIIALTKLLADGLSSIPDLARVPVTEVAARLLAYG